MSSEGGPWGSEAPEPPARPRPPVRLGRYWPWLVLLLGLAGLILALVKAFPEAVHTRDQWSEVLYYAMFLVLLAAGAFRGRLWGGGRQLVGHIGAWLAVAAVLALVYAYREELAGVPQHLALAFSTNRPVQLGDHELVIPQDDQGAFEVIGKVNGQRVRFMIDTGATDTVLTPADARRIGMDPAGLRYDYEVETANGKGYGAPFVAQRLEVGPIRLDDFPMSVNQAPMSSSLLGLSFLNRLASFEIRDRKLYVRWKDAPAG